MEILGQRPVWSMSGGEKVSSLDATYAEIARLETLALHLIAGLDETGYANDVGAGTTTRFLTLRYRIDAAKARRDVNLANALPKYPTVAAALPDPNPEPAMPADHNTADHNTTGDSGAGAGVLLHPAQAEAIVSALEKVPDTVPADDVRVAEERLVELGRTHGPLQLRDAGKLFRDRLDTDGPEPAEQKAYDREALKLKKADNGVAFTGYLANENAELFRTLIHAHAKPRKTLDGALDPRSRDKRQADALTTVLATATNPAAGNHTAMAPARPATGRAATPQTPSTRGMADSPGTAHPGGDTSADSAGRGHTTTGTTMGTAAPAGTSTDVGAGISEVGAVDDLAETLPGMPTDEERTAAATVAGNSTADGPAHSTDNAAQGPARGPAQGEGHGRGGGFIPGHGPKAHITVTIDFNDLKAATADKIGHLIYGDALSAATVRRLACDAQIVPVVLGSQSQPLDVGTTVRLATGPMRKALIARDKGCVCCDAPPIYCDAHHVVSWIDGGETKITNLVLICKRCHRDLHAGHWDIHISNGVVHVARPAWATPGPTPRGRSRPTTTAAQPTEPRPDAATAGAPARVWPRDTDPPWLTSAEAERLNPWGETPGEPNVPVRPRPPVFGVDPWGDTPGQRPTRAHKRQDAAPDPGSSLRSAGGFDPWGEGPGDSRPRSVSKEKTGKGTAAPGVDVWGDAVTPIPTVDRRRKPGPNAHGTLSPWDDLAPETADALNPVDEDPKTSHRTAEPSSGSTQTGDATATTAA